MKKFFIAFFLFVFLFVLSGCSGFGGTSRSNSGTSGTSSSSKKQCDHSYEFVKIEIPTKTKSGYEIYKCTICGEQKKELKYKSDIEATSTCEQEVIPLLKSMLKDPDSVKYRAYIYKYKPYAHDDYDDEKWPTCGESYVVDVHYNAKNSFGGYVGYQIINFNLYYSSKPTFGYTPSWKKGSSYGYDHSQYDSSDYLLITSFSND